MKRHETIGDVIVRALGEDGLKNVIKRHYPKATHYISIIGDLKVTYVWPDFDAKLDQGARSHAIVELLNKEKIEFYNADELKAFLEAPPLCAMVYKN